MRGYSENEKEFLRSNYSIIGCGECAKILNRNANGIWFLAKRMGLKKPLKKPKIVKQTEGSIFSEEEISFLNENYPKFGSTKCAENLGRDRQEVLNEARRLNIIYLNNKYSQDEIEFIKKNYPIHGGNICAKYCNKKPHAIRRYAQSRLKLNVSAKYYIDLDQFLNIETPEIAYYLGLLWADGSVPSNSRSYDVSVSLVSNDMNDIKWIFEKIGVFSITKKSNNYGWKEATSVRLSCSKLHKFLKDNDYCEKSGKSPEKILEKIPEHLRHYWWRGYCDGDGNICLNKRGGYRVTLASCFYQDWAFVKNLFEQLDIFGIYQTTDKINKKTFKRNRSSVYLIANTDGVLKFLEYIYKGVELDKIGLIRKYNKYLEILEKIELVKNKLKEFKYTKILMVDNKNQVVNEFESIVSASKFLNITQSRISNHLKGKKTRKIQGCILVRKSEYQKIP